MVAYGIARTFSKTPEKFGTGHDEGIVASEAANNANVGGAMIPLITLGIPGAPVDAILLGAMIMHRIQPGPLLFTTNANLVWAMIAAYFVANIMMFFVMICSWYISVTYYALIDPSDEFLKLTVAAVVFGLLLVIGMDQYYSHRLSTYSKTDNELIEVMEDLQRINMKVLAAQVALTQAQGRKIDELQSLIDKPPEIKLMESTLARHKNDG